MNDNITRTPLAWPIWFKRTPPGARRAGAFRNHKTRGHNELLTVSQARLRVMHEIGAFTKAGRYYRHDPKTVVISTNLPVGRDGYPLSNQKRVEDPGVAIYFVLDGKERCIPCDTYIRVEDNLAAAAATIEALRTIERHGSGMFEAAFSGFDALPSPETVSRPAWRDVLNYEGSDIHEAQLKYQRARKAAHPDSNGGSSDAFHTIQQAWKDAQQELGDHR